MKKITLLIAILFSLNNVAQKPQGKSVPKITISGKVIETNTKQPLEYATIVLTNVKSKRVSGGITNANGNFSIEIPKGNYNVKVEFIGFKTKDLGAQSLFENKNIGTILLSEDTETLEEVEVIAEKSTVEIRLDKKIYNVGKDMTVKGGTASDVLDNVPSVNVDAEGAVSLRGNENVRILIDGKPSALVGLSGTDALRNLPADAIEKVEVITSPSARYDAEGTAGILNIVLRKGKLTGFNGSVNLTLGNPDLFGIATSLNYRTKKINLFTNFGYRYRKGPGNSQSFFTFLEDDIITGYRDESRTFDRKNKNWNGSLGLEYFLNKKSSITGTFFYRNSDGDDIATNLTQFLNANQALESTQTRIENELETDKNYQYALNYTNNIDDKGQKLTIDIQYQNSEETEGANITNNNILAEVNTQLTTSTEQLYQLDYVLPIGENSQFEAGHKTELQDLDSDFRVRDANGNPFDNDPSNAINFKQNIYAFYAQFGSKINKFSYLLGLRSETTDIDLTLLTTNQTSDKNFTELFPTVNLGYELNDNENVTLGYSRRIRRPRHWFLNPFESRSSATNIFRGNPDLTPTFTSSFDLGYNTKIRKFNLGASIYYQHSTDIINRVTFTENRNGTEVFIRQPLNLNDEQRYGLEFTANYSPSKKVRLSGSFNYFNFNTDAFSFLYTPTNGEAQTVNLPEVSNTTWQARFNSRITLPWKIEWQTRIRYRGPREDAQSNTEGIFVTNLALSKDIFKEKATLVLNVSDLFNSRKRQGITNTFNEIEVNGIQIPTQTIANQAFQWRERQISLNFTYRFNQKKKRQSPQRNFDGGGEDFGG